MIRKGQNKNGGGMPCCVPYTLPGNLEILTIEIILDKMKILLTGLNKTPSFNKKGFLFHLYNTHNIFSTTYENLTLIGDFNMIPENEKLNDFREINNKQSFIKPDVYETGISDHHKTIFAV